MKANKYGAYCFNYTEDEYKKICSQTVGITEKSMIRKWGEIEGKKRWKEYCEKQSKTNTFEYKQEKYSTMKFVVSSTALLSHLQIISRVINSKNSMAILENFLLCHKGRKTVLKEQYHHRHYRQNYNKQRP